MYCVATDTKTVDIWNSICLSELLEIIIFQISLIWMLLSKAIVQPVVLSIKCLDGKNLQHGEKPTALTIHSWLTVHYKVPYHSSPSCSKTEGSRAKSNGANLTPCPL